MFFSFLYLLMVKRNSSKKSGDTRIENNDQLHSQILDKHNGLKAVTEMICQLEHILKKEPTHKDKIIKAESFLSDLTTLMHDDNKSPEDNTVKSTNKKKSNKIKTKKTKPSKVEKQLQKIGKGRPSKIQKQIKKIGDRTLKDSKPAIIFTIIFVILFVPPIQSIGQEPANSDVELKSKYLVQNLKGDTIDTHLSWRLVQGDVLHLNILNADKFPEMAEVIKNAVLSKSALEIDDSLLHKGPKGITSTYYEGWAGALETAAEQDTKLHVPTNFEIIQSKNGEGEILVDLSTMTDMDGYSGFTRTITDSSQNQILKSYITIYDVDTLSKSQLETIFLHEFGHAMGLAHSTAPEDLMHPTIKTNYPYISPCDIDALVSLYNDEESNQVICLK